METFKIFNLCIFVLDESTDDDDDDEDDDEGDEDEYDGSLDSDICEADEMIIYPGVDTELAFRSTAYHREFLLKIGVDALPDSLTAEIYFLKPYLAELNYALAMIYNEIDSYLYYQLPFDLDYLGNNWFR